VAHLQAELDDTFVSDIQAKVLRKIRDERLGGLVVDLSGVSVLDSFLAKRVFDMASMASLLGAKAIITGIQPGVAASLIELDFEQGGVLTATDLEEGLTFLEGPGRAEDSPVRLEEREQEWEGQDETE